MGPPAELYEHPSTTFVANFLGQSNLIRARVVDQPGDSVLATLPGGTVRIPRSRVPEGVAEVFVGIRPEKIRLHDEPATAADGPLGENTITGGRVVDASFIGVSTQYLVRTPWGQEIMVFEQNQGIENLNAVGDLVTMSFAAEHTFALDARQDAEAGIELDSEAA
jgi:spermidine/putrescine transport system ATP-binding protein